MLLCDGDADLPPSEASRPRIARRATRILSCRDYRSRIVGVKPIVGSLFTGTLWGGLGMRGARVGHWRHTPIRHRHPHPPRAPYGALRGNLAPEPAHQFASRWPEPVLQRR